MQIKKKILVYIGVIALSATLAAFTTKYALDKKNADEEILLGMLYQQNAGEYKALCYQAYNIAKMKVDQAVRSSHKNLAVITDLDETALDNSEGEAYAFKNDLTYDLHKWWLFGQAKAVPGAVEFFQYAKAQGIDIYYISNRPADTDVVNSTMRNMNTLGFPYTSPGDKGHFLFQPDGAPSTKEPRRKFVTDTLKKNVIVLLGDNLIDINTAFDKVDGKYLMPEERERLVNNFRTIWGDRYIVFPNAYYGDWESCLYNNQSNLSNDQKDAIRESLLKVVNFTGQ